MKRPFFDGRKTVVVNEQISGDFVPAEDVVMTVVSNGLALRGQSRGELLLVLPAQYSHCWHIEGDSEAEMFRANLMQVGIRFQGALDIRLEHRFSPFWGSSCRRTDAQDVDRLEMAFARQINRAGGHNTLPIRLASVDGGGVNLLRDVLDQDVPFGAANMEFSREPTSHSELGDVFRVTARGEATQYYVSTGQHQSRPGLHTFSMWVDPNSIRHIRIQLMDQSLQGVWADLDLEKKTATVNNLSALGSVRFLDEREGWLHIAVSTELSDPQVYTLLQVLDQNNRESTFDARGETIRFASPRLEFGTKVMR